MSLPLSLMDALRPLTLVTGHYGVGKTNFALNLALDLAREGREVCVVDLDIVNPYFRSSEYRNLLEPEGIRLVTPVMANSSLDTPSLSAAVDGVVEWAYCNPNRIAIFDIGGDDAGATALGRYSERIAANPYALIYVVNAYRNLTQDAQEALEILGEIEFKSNLKATAIVNNSHLRTETDQATVEDAWEFGLEVARCAGVPLAAQTVPHRFATGFPEPSNVAIQFEKTYSVQMLVKTPWE